MRRIVNMAIDRNPDGTFKKGSTPNPGGRPKGVRKLIISLCEKYNIEPVEAMIKILANPKTLDRDKIVIAKDLCDRMWGKPIQQTVNEHNHTTNNEASEAVRRLIDTIVGTDTE